MLCAKGEVACLGSGSWLQLRIQQFGKHYLS